jgi:hypothetical protein
LILGAGETIVKRVFVVFSRRWWLGENELGEFKDHNSVLEWMHESRGQHDPATLRVVERIQIEKQID